MNQSEALKIVQQTVEQCKLCQELVDNRTNTVFGVGCPNAKIMLLGEAPGKDEDKQGVPFVGRAGQLLNNIIQSIGWKREDLYICNILRCRPPGNRDPKPEEAKNCRQFLDMQIKIINPLYIICLGRVAAKELMHLDKETTMASIRGLHDWNDKKVLCTYHPSYLLRNPHAKQEVWKDLQILLKEMESALQQ